jgi:hypothetical protein
VGSVTFKEAFKPTRWKVLLTILIDIPAAILMIAAGPGKFCAAARLGCPLPGQNVYSTFFACQHCATPFAHSITMFKEILIMLAILFLPYLIWSLVQDIVNKLKNN